MAIEAYSIHYINGYSFPTMIHGEGRSTMNYGVCIRGTTYAQSTNKGDYYGLIQEILQVQYPGMPENNTILFKCEWFDLRSRDSMRVHLRYRLVEINHRKRCPKYEPFVLAHQAV
jgi:hypothetical protein